MTAENLITSTEDQLRELAVSLTDVRDGECLLCYVYRMLELGCSGLRWAGRYRDIRAPRATGLERRLGTMGGFCDCEIFMNAYEPIAAVCTPPPPPPTAIVTRWPSRSGPSSCRRAAGRAAGRPSPVRCGCAARGGSR